MRAQAKMSQNCPKFCDILVKIAPDFKKQVFVAKMFKNWASFGVKISFCSEKLGLLLTAYNYLKQYGVFG